MTSTWDEGDDMKLLAAFAKVPLTKEEKEKVSSSAEKDLFNIEKKQQQKESKEERLARMHVEKAEKARADAIRSVTKTSFAAADATLEYHSSQASSVAALDASSSAASTDDSKADPVKAIEQAEQMKEKLDKQSLADVEVIVKQLAKITTSDKHAEKAHSLLTSYASRLGRLYVDNGDTRKAIKQFTVSLDSMKKSKAGGAAEEIGVLKQMQEAYSDIGRFDDAQMCENKILELEKKSIPVKEPASAISESDLHPQWESAIEHALTTGDFSMAVALLPLHKGLINHNSICTILHVAAAKGDTSMVKYFLDRGADTSIKAGGDGLTPKQWAEKFSMKQTSTLL